MKSFFYYLLLLICYLQMVSCNDNREANKSKSSDVRKISSEKIKDEVSMKATHASSGLVQFNRSKALQNTRQIGVYSKKDGELWSLSYGSRAFSEVAYGDGPKFNNDINMNPRQRFPSKGSPRPLKEGEKILLVLTYTDDKLLMTPSSSDEAWEGVVPEEGDTVLWNAVPDAVEAIRDAMSGHW